MARRFSGILFVLCGALIGIPPGWRCWSCCPASCCGPEAKPKPRCCCRIDEGERCPAPCRPAKAPPCAPQGLLCCHRDYTAPKAQERPAPPDVLPAYWLPFEFRAHPVLLQLGASRSFLPDPDPPLHLRLCVWRC